MAPAPFAERFGTLIRERRAGLGLTQETLAENIGISQPAVSEWERGLAVPTAFGLVGVLRELNITMAEVEALMDGDGAAA